MQRELHPTSALTNDLTSPLNLLICCTHLSTARYPWRRNILELGSAGSTLQWFVRHDISTFDACSVQCDETHILGCNDRGTLELVREEEVVIQICRLHYIIISARTGCLRDLVEFWWIRKNERCGSYLHLLQIRAGVWGNTKP